MSYCTFGHPNCWAIVWCEFERTVVLKLATLPLSSIWQKKGPLPPTPKREAWMELLKQPKESQSVCLCDEAIIGVLNRRAHIKPQIWKPSLTPTFLLWSEFCFLSSEFKIWGNVDERERNLESFNEENQFGVGPHFEEVNIARKEVSSNRLFFFSFSERNWLLASIFQEWETEIEMRSRRNHSFTSMMS